MKVELKPRHRFRMKSNDVLNTQDPTDEYVILGVEFHADGVALVVHAVAHSYIFRSHFSATFSSLVT